MACHRRQRRGPAARRHGLRVRLPGCGRRHLRTGLPHSRVRSKAGGRRWCPCRLHGEVRHCAAAVDA
eukprot:3281611-Alexandrium_andersonii.AAC.1